MACGTPVVTSLDTAMAEIAGEAAVLVDPLDVSAIAAGILAADARRDELARAGAERAREFTWQRSADAVVELWRELV
jgi:glycosyltransferase involved in cell wall biosynthesis